MASKPSTISEGVTEIRIDIQHCMGNNLRTWHMWTRKATWVATVHDVIKELGRVIIFHMNTLADTPWVAWTLCHYTSVKRGKVSSNLVTHEATKFAGLHISCMRQNIIKCLFIQTQSTWPLIDTSGGYHRGAPNLWSRPLILLPIQYSPLSPNCPPGLILNNSINYSSSQPKSHEWNLTLDLYRSSIR
jgi:hypothetical protein